LRENILFVGLGLLLAQVIFLNANNWAIYYFPEIICIKASHRDKGMNIYQWAEKRLFPISYLDKLFHQLRGA
jgi:hypothetical protein